MTLFRSNNQHGFSLPELMVAMTIGLLVTMAIASLFITTRQDYRQNDSTAKMQENARFALESITNDLRHAGFFGNIPSPGDINIDTMTLASPTSDCGPTASGKAGLYNFSESHLVLSFGNQMADAGTHAFYGSCLDAADQVKPDSSVLMIKRVAGEPTPPLLNDDLTTASIDETATDDRQNNTPYVYSNGGEAFLYTHPSTVPLPITNGEHWEYQPRIYYIDTNQRLHRKRLSNLALVDETLVDGIEAFHIEFGVDTMPDGKYDGVPGYFFTPPVNADPATVTTLNEAVSATIYVLARTTEPDPDISYQDEKSFQLGATGPAIPAANDRFHRRVYSTTIMLKNIRNQVMSR